jgi:mannosyltransferase
VLLFAFSRWQQPLFVDRYVLFSLAGVPLLAAAGAEGLVRLVRPLRRADWQRPVTLAGVAAIAVSFLWQFPLHERERRPTSRHDDLGQVAALVGAAVPPGEWVLFVPSYQRRVALAYPRHFAGLHDLALREPVSRSGTLNGRDVRPAVVRARLARLDRVWVVAVPGIERAPWFRANHGEQDKLAALRENFTGVATVAVRSGTVTRYERPRPGPGPVADRTGATTRPYPHRPGPVTLPAGSRQWPPSKKSVVSSCSLP